ncbi:MAG: cobalamin biosynthesis protein CobW [Pseudomonadota bacterium]
MTGKIPATVVTGFLGAGKTTLIRHLVEQAGGQRIALIINEFGDLGVDGEILKGCGIEGCAEDDVVELSNGCICCTVAEDFVPGLVKLIERDAPPDHIVIETSGLALPQPLVQAFNWPEIRTRVTVDGVVTVVDGPALAAGRFAADEAAVDRQRRADTGLDHATPLAELFEDQLACADMVLLSKADLLGPSELAAQTARLEAALRPGVRVVPAERGAVDPAVLLGLGIGAETDIARHVAPNHHHHHHHSEDGHGHGHGHGHGDGHGDGHGHGHDHAHGHGHGDDHAHGHGHNDHAHAHEHGHDAFESFVVELPEIDDAACLAQAVAEAVAAHGLLRVKGFAAIAGRPMRLVLQAVGPRIETHYDRPFAGEPRRTRLVVIGLAGLDRGAIAAALMRGVDAAALV